MSYEIPPEASVQASLRRVLEEQVRRAADHASNQPRVDLHDDVHEIRKALKKARAVLRLVRDVLPAYKAENARYRDIARRLSAPRDAAAIIESVDRMWEELEAELGKSNVESFRARLAEQRDASLLPKAVEPMLRQVAQQLETGLGAVSTLQLTSDGFDAVSGGFTRTYVRGQQLFRAAQVDSSPAHFHQWRKRAKYHRHQFELLVGHAPPTPLVHELTDILGQAQDVTVLLGVVDTKPLRALLMSIRARMQAQAMELGARVYRGSADEVVQRLRGVWEH